MDGVLDATEPLAQLAVPACMMPEFFFTPELHLRDGRIIRDLEDAAGFAREQQARPGVDQRDEILHAIERADRGASPRGQPIGSFAGLRSLRSSNSGKHFRRWRL